MTWSVADGATYYEVYQGSSKYAEVEAPKTSYTDTEPMRGLFGGLLATRYAVKACNEVGCSDFSAIASTHGDTTPSAFDLNVATPTVSASAPTVGTGITLNATVHNQGSGRSEFATLRYYQSTDSTITTSDTEVGTDPVSRLDATESRAELISLTAPSTPRTYYYGACVDAVTDETDSTNNCSRSVSITVGASAGAPGTPGRLTATANGQTQIDMLWTEPSADGGTATTGYRIEVSPNGTSWSDLVAGSDSMSTSYSHTGLTAGSTRHYRLSAINSVGKGPASNAASATTDEEPASDSTCTVDLIVGPGESCVYPGTSTQFSVDSNGRGIFLFYSAGSKIELRNSTINGVTYTFVASQQSSGSWLIEEVG